MGHQRWHSWFLSAVGVAIIGTFVATALRGQHAPQTLEIEMRTSAGTHSAAVPGMPAPATQRATRFAFHCREHLKTSSDSVLISLVRNCWAFGSTQPTRLLKSGFGTFEYWIPAGT